MNRFVPDVNVSEIGSTRSGNHHIGRLVGIDGCPTDSTQEELRTHEPTEGEKSDESNTFDRRQLQRDPFDIKTR